MRAVKPSEMKLGDVLQVFDGAFGTACVTKITPASVQVHRPYGVTSDFETTAGVSFYTGVEVYEMWLSSDFEYTLLSRKEVQ